MGSALGFCWKKSRLRPCWREHRPPRPAGEPIVGIDGAAAENLEVAVDATYSTFVNADSDVISPTSALDGPYACIEMAYHAQDC